MIWKFIDSATNTGSYNMEFDMMLARTLKSDQAILRLYGWKPYCISLGANQPEDSLNIEKAKSLDMAEVHKQIAEEQAKAEA